MGAARPKLEAAPAPMNPKNPHFLGFASTTRSRSAPSRTARSSATRFVALPCEK